MQVSQKNRNDLFSSQHRIFATPPFSSQHRTFAPPQFSSQRPRLVRNTEHLQRREHLR